MVISSRDWAHSAWLVGGAFALSGLASALGACSGGDSASQSAAGTSAGGGVTAGSSTSGSGGAPASAGMTMGAGTTTGGFDAGGSAAGGSNAGGALGSGGAAGVSTGGAGTGGSAPAVSPEGDGDFEVGPTYTKDPNLTDQGKPKGKKFSFSMSSANSTVFKGDDVTLKAPAKQAWNRNISVYVPAQYKDGDEAALLVIQDGPGPIDSISRALDNLTLSTDPLKKLPPFVAIAVQSGSALDGSDGQGSERGLEYDTMSDRYARFIDADVLPAVVADPLVHAAYPGLKFTKDPEGRGAYGCSSGGAAALAMGWFVPTSWHRIITYSGTFVAQQNPAQTAETTLYPFGAWEYHSDKELIKNTDNKPLRIFLNANEDDMGKGRPEADHHDWVVANQRTAAALKAKNYHYHYVYGLGLGHCDGKVQDLTSAEALSWAWRGYAQ